MNNKKNDNLLNDIEFDLDKDWSQLEEENTAKKIKVEEKRIRDYIIKNPQGLDISYRRFYETLYRIFNSRDGNGNHAMYDLQEMLSRIFSHQKSAPLPRGFEEVWDMFCDPRRYKCISDIKCNRCSNIYDIISQFHQHIPSLENRYEYENRHIENERILCPTCGNSLLNLHGYKLKGIFKHENRNDYRIMEIERMKMQERMYGSMERDSYENLIRNETIAESYGLYNNE